MTTKGAHLLVSAFYCFNHPEVKKLRQNIALLFFRVAKILEIHLN